MNNLVIRGLIEENDLLRLLSTLCVNIQKEYDIHPGTLSHLINNPSFLHYCRFLYYQCYGEMITNLNQFKTQYNIGSLKEVTSPEESEKCGHLIKTHRNGYITYCNVHKYMHPHSATLSVFSDPDLGYIQDHVFVTKNQGQIVREKYNFTIYTMYSGFINKLYLMIRHLFNHLIKTQCSQSIIKITTPEKMLQVIETMRHDPKIFKSKTIYQHLTEHTPDPKNTGQPQPRYYYAKCFHLDVT